MPEPEARGNAAPTTTGCAASSVRDAAGAGPEGSEKAGEAVKFMDESRRAGHESDLDGPLDPDLPLKLLLVMALCAEAERLVPDRTAPPGPDGAPPP